MPIQTIETPQLVLREPIVADAVPVYAIQGDREAMAHTYWAPNLVATQERLAAYHAQTQHSPHLLRTREYMLNISETSRVFPISC